MLARFRKITIMNTNNPSPAQRAAAEYLTNQGRVPVITPAAKPTVMVPGGRISNTESARRLFEAIAPRRELPVSHARWKRCFGNDV